MTKTLPTIPEPTTTTKKRAPKTGTPVLARRHLNLELTEADRRLKIFHEERGIKITDTIAALKTLVLDDLENHPIQYHVRDNPIIAAVIDALVEEGKALKAIFPPDAGHSPVEEFYACFATPEKVKALKVLAQQSGDGLLGPGEFHMKAADIVAFDAAE